MTIKRNLNSNFQNLNKYPSYKLRLTNKVYYVIETADDVVIKKTKKSKEAVNFIIGLRSGSAFAGFTPRFFLKKDEQLHA